jgi:copper chaperone CopZ
VTSAEVSYQSGQAVVFYDPNVVDLDAIRGAIDGTGFKAGQVIDQHRSG